MSSGGPGSGLFKSTDGGTTWQELTRNTGLPARGHRQDRGERVGRRSHSCLRDRRAQRGGRVPLRRWRRDLDARERRPPAAAARLLLLAHLRGPEEPRHALRAQYRLLQVDRRRDDLHDHCRAARRQPRPVDRSRATPRAWSTATTAAATSRSTAARPGRRRTTRRRSSITSRRPGTCRTTSAARSRTTRRSASRATAAAIARSRAAWRRLALHRRWRGERVRRAPSRRSRHLLRGQPGCAAHAVQPATGHDPRCSGLPAVLLGRAVERAEGALAVDVSDRVLTARSRTCSTPRRSTCGGRATAGSPGSASAPT